MGFSDYLNQKQAYWEQKQAFERERYDMAKQYNDIAYILLYSVLCDKMGLNKGVMEQTEPFRIWDYGKRFFRYNFVLALDSAELREKFQVLARQVLRSKDFNVRKVRVYDDCVIVSL